MGRGTSRSASLLARIAALLGTSDDPARTVRRALTLARSALGVSTMRVATLDGDLISSVVPGGRRPMLRLPLADALTFRKMLRTKRVAAMALGDHPSTRVRKFSARHRERHVALAPIFQDGQIAGALVAARTTARAFSAGEQSLLGSVARMLGSLLALGIERRERRRNESSRRSADRLFQTVLAGVDALIYLRDRDGRYLTINDAVARLLGRPINEIIGHPVEEFFLPEQAARIRANDASVIKSGQGDRFEDSLEFAGEIRRFIVSKRPFRDDRGRLRGVIGVAQDVTELRLSEARLRESEEFHRLVLDNLNEGVSVLDREGRLLAMNAKGRTLFGSDQGRIPTATTRDPQWDPVKQDGSRLRPEEFATTRSLESGRTISGHVLGIRDSTGHRMWISLTAVPLFHAGESQAYAVVTSFTDVTERRAMEEALQRSEARYRGIVDGQQDLICRYTPDCVLTFVNASFARYFAKRPEELIGQSFLGLVPELDREMLLERVADLVAAEKPSAFLQAAIDGNGERRMQYWQNHVVAAAPGEPVELQAVGRDVTDDLRASDQLRRSHEELRALALRLQRVREEERKRIAREIHDGLGQALTAIRMDLQWLLGRLDREGSGPVKVRRPSQSEVCDKLGAASLLTDETLKLVRRIATDLRPGVLDHVGLLAAIEWEAQQFESRVGIRCSVRSANGEPALEPDTASAVYRIFQEALTNVARHAHARSVSVSLTADAGSLRLEVEDDGIGINPAALDSSSSLGLVGMRERALGLGGQLGVGAGSAGGTRVSLHLPRSANAR